MLVLSRKVGERIMIGESNEIVITVIEVIGRRVRLGIEAPRSITIRREELSQVPGRKPSEGADEQGKR